MNILGQLLCLPATVFVYSLEIMVRSLQGMQEAAQRIGDSRSTTFGAVPGGATMTPKETGQMSEDQSRRDEVKLYEYYILSIKRDDERVVAGPRSVIVTSDMSGEAFTSWVISMYFQEKGHEEIPHGDKKYLRVSYRVACSFPRERPEYQKDQVTVLREIRDALGGGPFRATA